MEHISNHQDVVVEFIYYALQATLLMGVFGFSFLLIYGGLKLAAWLTRKIKELN